MKNSSRVKIGKKLGNPAFRTPSSFRFRQSIKNIKNKQK